MPQAKKKFWDTLPGILTGLAALIGALATLIVAWPKATGGDVTNVNTADPAPSLSYKTQPEQDPPPIAAAEVLPSATDRGSVAPDRAVRHLSVGQSRLAASPESGGVTVPRPNSVRRAIARSNDFEVNVRQARSTNAPVLGHLTPAEVIAVSEYRDGWWRTELPTGEVGYVDARFVLVIDRPRRTRVGAVR